MNPDRLDEAHERYQRGDDDTLELILELLANGRDPLDHRNKGRDIWIADIKRYQADHVALLAEVDRLTAELAEAREDSHFLETLYVAGLDGWDRYEYAMSLANGDTPADPGQDDTQAAEPSAYARAINAPLSPETIAALNRELTSGDPARYTRAVPARRAGQDDTQGAT